MSIESLREFEQRRNSAIVASGIDFGSQAYIDNPYATYARLRRDEPVARVDALNAWFVTRYKDVRAIALDEKHFQVDFERLQINRMGMNVLQEPFFQFGREFVVFTDRPHHYELKKLLMSAFTRKRAEDFIPTMHTIANEVMDEFIGHGSTDLMSHYAHEVPLRIISRLLSVPTEDRALMAGWVQDYSPVIGFPPLTADQLERANEATRGFEAYFSSCIAQRRSTPNDDLISQVLALNEKREKPFSELQLVSNLILLYFAGQDTQKQHFGNMLLALYQHPQDFAWMVEEPGRVWTVLDELMRYDGVSQITARVAMEDVELHGVTIKQGETVLLGLGSANRDPEFFADPEKFDLHRQDARSAVTFGLGPHSCLGTHFARLLMPIMLETLLTRIPTLKIDLNGLVRSRTLSKRGYSLIPASW